MNAMAIRWQPRLGGWRLSINLLAAVATLLLLALLINLGMWQLRRADEKRHYLEQLAQQAARGPQPLTAAAHLGDLVGAELQVHGHFLHQYPLLLDNQVWQGAAGYQLVVPFQGDDGRPPLLVNLGWVPAADRRILPHPAIPSGELVLYGRLKGLDQQTMVLKQTAPEGDSWPLRVQQIDLQQLAPLLPTGVEPYLLLLAPELPFGYPRQWQAVTISPDKHLAYAVQWFAMALALLVLMVVISIKPEARSKP